MTKDLFFADHNILQQGNNETEESKHFGVSPCPTIVKYVLGNIFESLLVLL